ncbi:unnamed protein product [Trichogramma brassicae]|uniref:Uncharacterized protein n=1 Tax=Trichogramma brassicae TaxID=86971 RepID=A0A6H5IKJ0_9HYME|nr:unnamed protein product [Trichogramma brassicae]
MSTPPPSPPFERKPAQPVTSRRYTAAVYSRMKNVDYRPMQQRQRQQQSPLWYARAEESSERSRIESRMQQKQQQQYIRTHTRAVYNSTYSTTRIDDSDLPRGQRSCIRENRRRFCYFYKYNNNNKPHRSSTDRDDEDDDDHCCTRACCKARMKYTAARACARPYIYTHTSACETTERASSNENEQDPR